jgi:predicted nucleic acid-binding protein
LPISLKNDFHDKAVEINKNIEHENKIISNFVIAETLTVLKQKKKIKSIEQIKNT